MEIDKEQNDACIKFMHPHGPARSFHWPEQEQGCRKHLKCVGGANPKGGTLPHPFLASKGHFCIFC